MSDDAAAAEGGEPGPAPGGTVEETVPAAPEAGEALAFPPGEGGDVAYRRTWLHTLEDAVPVLAIAAMVALPLGEIVARLFAPASPARRRSPST